MSRQLTFPERTTCTKVYPDGRQERVIYGQYEAVMLAKENGYLVDRFASFLSRLCWITDVECEDGTKLVFDEPFYRAYLPREEVVSRKG